MTRRERFSMWVLTKIEHLLTYMACRLDDWSMWCDNHASKIAHYKE